MKGFLPCVYLRKHFGVNSIALGDNSKAYGDNSKGYGDRIHRIKRFNQKTEKAYATGLGCDMHSFNPLTGYYFFQYLLLLNVITAEMAGLNKLLSHTLQMFIPNLKKDMNRIKKQSSIKFLPPNYQLLNRMTNTVLFLPFKHK
ncbi:hypothetical protein E1J05_25235 [Phocaeicola dorei]|nr:hypothetical protein E1J05_25235 [Phocaeicola dorei]